jgi:hypothetical protein
MIKPIEGEPLRLALARTRKRFDVGAAVVLWFWLFAGTTLALCLVWLWRQVN